jgi:hypothetical protein
MKMVVHKHIAVKNYTVCMKGLKENFVIVNIVIVIVNRDGSIYSEEEMVSAV